MQSYMHMNISRDLCEEILALFKGRIMQCGTTTYIPDPKKELQAFTETWDYYITKSEVPLVSGRCTWVEYWDNPAIPKEITRHYAVRLTPPQYRFILDLRRNLDPATGLSIVKAINQEDAYNIKNTYRELSDYNLFRRVARQTYLLNPLLKDDPR